MLEIEMRNLNDTRFVGASGQHLARRGCTDEAAVLQGRCAAALTH